jgi:formate hydrogenlyase transcriptional activator
MRNRLEIAVNPSNWSRNPIARDTRAMRMSPAANALEPASLSDELSSRYQALIRLEEAIRSHPDEKDLFQSLANELHEVVEFDAFCQFDCTANWLQWYFVEPYKSGLEARRLEPVPKEETAAWWMYQNQQPVVIRLGHPDSRFPRMHDRLVQLGLKSSCTLPLSTAHRRLGSLSFASHVEDAYLPDELVFLSLVANQIAVAIDDALAQKRLKLILDLTNRVVSKLELSDLLHDARGRC